jgi:S-(hydroxymethyl)mycothiol dehydrogenase
MGQRGRGVIARSEGAPVEVVTVLVPDPGPREALVRVQACGVCHTDLHHREGAIAGRFPKLLGHEAAGVVEAVGPGVTGLGPGDHVVLAWRAPCGRCRFCARGRPWYCRDSLTAARPTLEDDGTPLSTVLGIGGFAGRALVAAGQAVRVDPAVPARVACLIGCGVMTGFGAVVNTAGVRHDDTVAVFGCGGVGDAAVHAAALAGARKVIAVDLNRRKLAWAAELGATDLVDASQVDPVAAVRELTGGFGADVTIEAVGHPEVLKQAFQARDHTGTLVQVGVPDPTMRVDLRLLDLFGRGGALKPSWYGDCLPTRDFPALADLYRRGRFDLDRFVSETIPLDQVEDAFARMRRGEVLRWVVVLEDA